MITARSLSSGNNESRPGDAEGSVFVLCIDRAKMIRDLLEVIDNPALSQQMKD